MRKRLFTLLVLFFAAFAGLTDAAAQRRGPGGVNSDITNGPDHTAAVPIDGGLAILLAAGAGYGLRKYRSSRQQRKHQPHAGGSVL